MSSSYIGPIGPIYWQSTFAIPNLLQVRYLKITSDEYMHYIGAPDINNYYLIGKNIIKSTYIGRHVFIWL